MSIIGLEYLKASDPVTFAKEKLLSWLRGPPDDVQSKILRSRSRQIICNCHRQWGKSYTIGMKALHRAFYYPGSEILIASATLKQSQEMFKKISDASKYIDELEKIGDSKTEMRLRNESRIVTLPGTGGTVRGFTAPDLIIIDEAAWAIEALYMAMRPMMLMSIGQLILISTPHGKQGFYHDVWSHHGEVNPNGDEMMGMEDGWERYRVRAPDNKRVTEEWIQNEREQISERAFQQEYLCEFVETEDQVIPYDLIESMFTDDVDPMFQGDIMSDDIEPMFGDKIGNL